MRIVFSEFAKLEMNDAASFYELQFEGLGIHSGRRSARLPCASPTIPAPGLPDAGKSENVCCTGFPFSILYPSNPTTSSSSPSPTSTAGRIIGLNADAWRLRERPAEFSKAR
jgi:hypothetical protein